MVRAVVFVSDTAGAVVTERRPGSFGGFGALRLLLWWYWWSETLSESASRGMGVPNVMLDDE